jgi:hypothetical protein
MNQTFRKAQQDKTKLTIECDDTRLWKMKSGHGAQGIC